MKRTIERLAGNIGGVARCLALVAAIGVAGEAEATLRQIKVAQGNYTWAETSASKTTYAWESTSEATAGVPVAGDAVYCSRLGTVTGTRTVTLPSGGTARISLLSIYGNAGKLTTFKDGDLLFDTTTTNPLWIQSSAHVTFENVDFGCGEKGGSTIDESAIVNFENGSVTTFKNVTFMNNSTDKPPALSFDRKNGAKGASTVNFVNTVATLGIVISASADYATTRYLNFTNTALTVGALRNTPTGGIFCDDLELTMKLGSNNNNQTPVLLVSDKVNSQPIRVKVDASDMPAGTYSLLKFIGGARLNFAIREIKLRNTDGTVLTKQFSAAEITAQADSANNTFNGVNGELGNMEYSAPKVVTAWNAGGEITLTIAAKAVTSSTYTWNKSGSSTAYEWDGAGNWHNGSTASGYPGMADGDIAKFNAGGPYVVGKTTTKTFAFNGFSFPDSTSANPFKLTLNNLKLNLATAGVLSLPSYGQIVFNNVEINRTSKNYLNPPLGGYPSVYRHVYI